MDEACIFCKILAGEIPATFAYRDERVAAIADVNPQAPTHLLVMPVVHVANMPALADSQPALVSEVFSVASRLGRAHGGDDGFRTVVNTGPGAGQTVEHMHVHVLAGRDLRWPPG
jgi:histidine triad (HIT) family protein